MDLSKIKANKTQYVHNGLLALQHTFAMMGATILVPILCNLSISLTLISAGMGTLLFYAITGRKVPVFLGSSFAFIPAILGTIPSADQAQIGSELWLQSMGKLSVGLFMAGLVYVLMAILVRFLGVKKVQKLFPPVVIGPIIMVIGLNLAPVVFSGNIQGMYTGVAVAALTAPQIQQLKAKVWIVVVVTAIVILIISGFMKRGFFSSISILIGMLAGYIVAIAIGLVDFSPVKNAHWVIFEPNAIKEVSFYKYLSFDAKTVMLFAPLSLVTCMEHIGDISVNSAVVGKNFLVDPGLHRTLLGDGCATMLAGFIGGPANTTYGENTAVLQITKNYNPNVIALAGCFAIIMGIFSKISGIIATIPSAVIGGASMILFGMIAANGLKVIVDNKVDIGKPRNLFTISLILVIGIGMGASGINLKIKDIVLSPLAVVTIIGVVINALFEIADKFRGHDRYNLVEEDEEMDNIFEYRD